MKIGYILFQRMTMLDFAGVYDAIARLKILGLLDGLEWDLCGLEEEVSDELGMKISVTKVGGSLAGYDLIFVPGGIGTRTLREDDRFVEWMRTAKPVPLKASVCSGALLLGAAGFLQGKRATTNPPVYDLLASYCEEVSKERIVRDGPIVTAGGVATSVDLGLYLVQLLTDAESVRKVQQAMDYPYYDPAKANEEGYMR